MSVQVSVILDRKGSAVATIRPDATVADAARELAAHNVGALVVSEDGQTVAGIVSERDIVRRLAASGGECLDWPVARIMTVTVTTCDRAAQTDDLMAIMTNSRIRHIPVIEDGRLAGMISIGDVVKARINELETETVALQEYVTGSSY